MYKWLQDFQADTNCLILTNQKASTTEIEEVEQILGIPLPLSYRAFWQYWNGAKEFTEEWNIFSTQELLAGVERYGFQPYTGEVKLVGEEYGFIYSRKPTHLLTFAIPLLSSDLYCFDTSNANDSDYPVYEFDHEMLVAKEKYSNFEHFILKQAWNITEDLDFFLINGVNEEQACSCSEKWETTIKKMLVERGYSRK